MYPVNILCTKNSFKSSQKRNPQKISVIYSIIPQLMFIKQLLVFFYKIREKSVCNVWGDYLRMTTDHNLFVLGCFIKPGLLEMLSEGCNGCDKKAIGCNEWP